MSLIKKLFSVFSGAQSNPIKDNSNKNTITTNSRNSNLISSDSLPSKSIYEAPASRYSSDIVSKDLGITRVETSIPEVTFTMQATLQISGVIPATPEEVEECFSRVEWFISESNTHFKERISLRPFRPFENLISGDNSFSCYENTSPLHFEPFIKAIRAKIRELNKQKITTKIYLHALIMAIYLQDICGEIGLKGVYKETTFNIVESRFLLDSVVLEDIRGIPLEYQSIGYKNFPSFGKTDIKWITKEFGEPLTHSSPANLVLAVKRRAVIDYFKRQREQNPSYYKNKNSALDSLAWSLKVSIASYLGYHKSWYERVERRGLNKEVETQYLQRALEFTYSQFVVADLETTGLDSGQDEIIEFGAILCDDTGYEISRFEVLVNPGILIPKEISDLTGITNEMVTESGKSLDIAFSEFVSFVGNHPIFFHNSDFDCSFLKVASEKVSIPLNNLIFDTLTMSRAAWKDFRRHNLASLAKELGIDPPIHRAMADVAATQKILLKIRENHPLGVG